MSSIFREAKGHNLQFLRLSASLPELRQKSNPTFLPMEGSHNISNDVGSSWDAIVQSSRQFALPGNPIASPHAHGSRTCPVPSHYPFSRHLDPPNFPLPTYIRDVPNPERIAGTPTTRRTTSRPALPSNSLTSSFRNRLGTLTTVLPLEMPTVSSRSPIDLTVDSSPSFTSLPRISANPRKRSASSLLDLRQSPALQSHTLKRRALNISDIEGGSLTKIDEADLTEVNDDNTLLEVIEQQKEQQREQQRVKAIKAQQDLAKQPVTFSTLKCIICMDALKDITVTHCGEYLW